jgi:hypothetical protein
MVPSPITLKDEALVDPNSTAETPALNPLPEIETWFAPVVLPELGETPVTCGPAAVYVN